MPLEKQRRCVADRLADQTLQKALAKALAQVREKSAVALDELCDHEGLFHALAAERRACLDSLPSLLLELEANLQSGGSHVLWAATAQHAVDAVVELAKARGVSQAIFAKSMVAEEIELEKGLERSGVTVTQTDLGERIVQLAGQRPSHVTAPCIHMNKETIAELLHKTGGMPLPADAPEMCRFLSHNLRHAFCEAGMGVTGANTAVASTGEIVLVENEGNVRMSYTVPRLHVVLLGIERLVQSPEQALHLLDLLPRAATGQRSPAYISWLPPTPLPGQERFVIFVDNGRTELYSTALHRNVLACIRCGRCMNICPVYERVGGHAYGWTYPGPIGLALAPFLAPGQAAEALNLCTLCGACAEACPVEIPLDSAIVRSRAVASMDPDDRQLQEILLARWAKAWATPARYKATHWAHRTARKLFPKKVGRMEERFGWGEGRLAPIPARQLFRIWWKRNRRKEA